MEKAVKKYPDFADIERIRQTRHWPPRLLDTLKIVQDDVAAKNGKNKKSGCSCDINQNTQMPFAALFLFVLSLFGLFSIRRREN